MAFYPGVDNTDDQMAFVYSMYSPSIAKSELVGSVPPPPPYPTPVVDENGIIQNTFAELSQISNYSTDISRFQGLSIGDKLPITLNGTVGTLSLDNYSCYAYIIGFDHNADLEGYGITFQLVSNGTENIAFEDDRYNSGLVAGNPKLFVMKSVNSNAGGWGGSTIRYTVLGSTDVAPQNNVGYDATPTCATNPVDGTLMKCLPEDLRGVMKPIKKWTDNSATTTHTQEDTVTELIDYLPLLSEFETFGRRLASNIYEQEKQAQYDYYVSGSRQKFLYRDNQTLAKWWLRSPSVSFGTVFCAVQDTGAIGSLNVTISLGIAPIFLI